MEVLVINLMRLGDLVQCTPVLRRLRAEYPEGRISLMVMDLFEDTARLLPGVDRLLVFPSVRLAAMLDQDRGWPEALIHLDCWLAEHFPRRPDLVINLTPNRLASTLALATGAPEIRGMALNPQRELITRPAWASYSLIVSRARVANPFNLVDLFLREAGLTPDGDGLAVMVPEAATLEVEKFLANLGLPENSALVGLMPGASRPERCWPPESFAAAAGQLLRMHPCHFFIFGSPQETPLGEAIGRALPEGTATPLLGKTSPPLLAAFLQRLNLLITNDTGPMHLAAAVGTPTLGLFLASARVQDTGPVGRGHVVLEPRLSCHPCQTPCPRPLCHQSISPETVAFWAAQLLKGTRLSPGEEALGPDTARVYLGTADPWGYQAFLPLVRRPLDRRELFIWLHRWVWGEFLDGNGGREENFPLGAWILQIFKDYYLPPEENPISLELKTSIARLVQESGRAAEMAREIAELAAVAREFPVRLWIKNESLNRLEQGLRQLAVAVPELSAHLAFFFQEQQGISGQDLVPLALELHQAYTRLRRLGELTQTCLTILEDFLSPTTWKEWPSDLAQTLHIRICRQGPPPPEREEFHASEH